MKKIFFLCAALTATACAFSQSSVPAGSQFVLELERAGLPGTIYKLPYGTKESGTQSNTKNISYVSGLEQLPNGEVKATQTVLTTGTTVSYNDKQYEVSVDTLEGFDTFTSSIGTIQLARTHHFSVSSQMPFAEQKTLLYKDNGLELHYHMSPPTQPAR